MKLHFTVPGEPVSKGRPRVTSRGTYTPAKTREHEKLVRLVALKERLESVPCWPMDARYLLTVRVIQGTKHRRDIDNVGKLVADALNGIAWDDDSQVDGLTITRHYATRTEAATNVTVETIECDD